MQPLWEIRLEVPGDAETWADMLAAACDTETVSYHRDHDDAPWRISAITETEPDPKRLHAAMVAARMVTGLVTGSVTGSPASITPASIMPSMPIVESLADRDWLAENRKSFPPLDIASFRVYGSHITDPVPAGRIGLLIDAGQAFGSGTHASTHGCVTMLEKYLDRHAASSVADIGCGSGILAMAAAKLNPHCRIIAVDNDPVAVRVAADNAAINGVAGSITCGVSDGYQAALVADHAPYQVILANILPSPLMEMAADATACLAPDGVLIVAGLMDIHVDDVQQSHEAHGLTLRDSMIFNDWATLVFSHKGEGSND